MVVVEGCLEPVTAGWEGVEFVGRAVEVEPGVGACPVVPGVAVEPPGLAVEGVPADVVPWVGAGVDGAFFIPSFSRIFVKMLISIPFVWLVFKRSAANFNPRASSILRFHYTASFVARLL